MSEGGTVTYKYPLIPWGGRIRSNLKLLKGAEGDLNCCPFYMRTQ